MVKTLSTRTLNFLYNAEYLNSGEDLTDARERIREAISTGEIWDRKFTMELHNFGDASFQELCEFYGVKKGISKQEHHKRLRLWRADNQEWMKIREEMKAEYEAKIDKWYDSLIKKIEALLDKKIKGDKHGILVEQRKTHSL